MNNDFNNPSRHISNLNDLRHLIAPSFSVVKEELSHGRTFNRGCAHFTKIIKCFFRKAWYGITHQTSWMSNEKIYSQIKNEVIKLDECLAGSPNLRDDIASLPTIIKKIRKSTSTHFQNDRNFLDCLESIEQSLSPPKDTDKGESNHTDASGRGVDAAPLSEAPAETTPNALTANNAPKAFEPKSVATPAEVPDPLLPTPFVEILEEEQTPHTSLGYLREFEGSSARNVPQLDEKLLAHVLGGFMIREENLLEGSNHGETLSYVLSFVDNFLKMPPTLKHEIPVPKLLKLRSELSQALKAASAIQQLQKNAKQATVLMDPAFRTVFPQNKQLFIEQTLQSLKDLEPGKTFLIPGGWSGVEGEPGHAMLYRFVKMPNGKVNLSIINTGAGLDAHDYVVSGTKKKFSPVRQFADLDFVDGQIDEKLLTSFLEKRLLPLTWDAPTFDWQDIYGVEVERLSANEVDVPLTEWNAITEQRSGICAYKSVLIAARLTLGVKDYKVFKQAMELDALSKGTANLKAGRYYGPLEHKIISILERASQRMMGATLKLRRDKLLTKQEAREAYSKAQTTLKEVEAFKQQPFSPFRSEIESNKLFSPSKLSKALSRSGVVQTISQNAPVRYLGASAVKIPAVDTPENFLAELKTCQETLVEIDWDSEYANLITADLLKQISDCNYIPLWKDIAANRELRHQALNLLYAIVSQWKDRDAAKGMLPKDFLDCIGIYTVFNLLAQRQWEEEPALKQFGCDFDIFSGKDILDRHHGSAGISPYQWESTHQLSPSQRYHKKLLEEINRGKDFLFKISKTTEFKEKEDFEKLVDCCFFESFLASAPDLQKSSSLALSETEKGHVKATPCLGVNHAHRVLRYQALKLFTNSSLFNSHPTVQAYGMLKMLNDFRFKSSPELLYEKVLTLRISWQQGFNKRRGFPKKQLSAKGEPRAIFKNDGWTKKSDPALNRPLFDDNHCLQNQTLADYPNSITTERLIERELRTIGANQQVQIDHLLELFESHPLWIQIPENQLYFRGCLLEGELLVDHLLSNPLIGERLVHFLEKSFQLFSIKTNHTPTLENINTLVFLCQLSQKVINHLDEHMHFFPVSPADQTLIQTFQQKILILKDMQRGLLTSLKDSQKEEWIQAYLAYTLLFTDNLLSEEALQKADPQVIQEKILEAAKARHHLVLAKGQKKSWKSAQDYYDGRIEREALTNLVNLQESLKKHLAPVAIPLCQSILQLYNYPQIPKEAWVGQFPTYVGNSDGNNFFVNLLTGEVKINSHASKKFPAAAREDLLYVHLFGETGSDLQWIPCGNNEFQTRFHGKTIHMQAKFGGLFLFFIKEEGKNYVLQSEKQIAPLSLPESLKQETLVWVNGLSPPAALIFDKNMQERLAEFSQNKLHKPQSPLVFCEIANDPKFGHLAAFQRERAFVWGKEDDLQTDVEGLQGDVKEMIYRGVKDENGHDLSFTADRKGNLCWNKQPEYQIAADQSLPALRGYPDYLLLQNPKKGKYILIVPRSDETGMCFSAVPLSQNKDLEPLNCLQHLHMTQVFLEEGNYEKALKHLTEAKEARAYTEKEQYILFLRIQDQEGGSGDPWACVLRIYAAAQGLDNCDLVPPSKRAEQKKKRRTVLEETLEDYRYFITNRNVPQKYQPTQVLGLDREIRLLEELREHFSLPVEIEHYLFEISKQQIPTYGKVFGGIEALISQADLQPPSSYSFLESISTNVSPEDWLTRPGKQFANNFKAYYAQAQSEDPQAREQLKERLLFMKFDKDPVNAWLVSVLSAIIYIKDKQLEIDIPGLPSIFSDPKGFRLFIKELDQLKTTALQKLEDVNKLKKAYQRVADDKPLLLIKPAPSLNVKENQKAQTPSFTPLDPALLKQKDYTNKVIPAPTPPSKVQLYTDEQLKALQVRLKLPAYVYAQLNSLNKQIAAETNDAIPQYTLKSDVSLEELRKEIDQDIAHKAPKIKQLQQQIVHIANKTTGDAKRDLELDLLRGSTKQEPWTLEKCLTIFLHDRWDLLETASPPLTKEEIDRLHQMLVEVLVLNIETNRATRALALIEELDNLKTDPNEAKKVQAELGQLLVTPRSYDVNTNPAMLLFEYASGWSITPAQTTMLHELFSKDAQGDYRHLILQLIMGAGKSKVISPIQAQMKADGEHLSLLVVPDSLYETNRNDYSKISRQLFGQTVKNLEFSREDNTLGYLKILLRTVEEAIEHREYLITRPKDLLCLELEHWESRLCASTLPENEAAVWKEKAALLKKILKLLYEKGDATFDESDTIFQSKYHVNFTFGEALAPSKDSVELVRDIYKKLAVHPQLRHLVRLHQNRQALLGDEQWLLVKNTLLQEITEEIADEYALPFSLEQLKNYCEGCNTVQNEATFMKLKMLYHDKNSSLKLKEGIRKLALLKFQVESLLKETLKKSGSTHYGFSKEEPQMGLGIPYSANNTPNEGSQFAELFETINKTFQIFLSGWEEPAQTVLLIDDFRRKVEFCLGKGEETEAQMLIKKFKDATGYELFSTALSQTELIDLVTRSLDERLKQTEPHQDTVHLVLEFVSEIPLQEHMKIHPSQLNSNTHDLDGMVASTQGYSGTSSKHSLPLRLNAIENPETDREICQALIEDQCPIHTITEDDPEQLLSSLLSKRKDAASFRAFIDTGTLFKGKSNLEVAKKMLSFFEINKQEVQAVIYWDDKMNTPNLLCRKHGLLQSIPLEGTSRDDVKALRKKLHLKANQLFTYYDERHIKGADLYHPPGSRAFVSHNAQTEKDDALQGYMRMRFTAKREHHLELVVQQEEARKIELTIQATGKGPLTINDILIHSGLVQATNDLQKNLSATQQMLLKKAKEFFRIKILEAETEQESQQWFESIHSLVKQTQEIDPFLEHGPLLSEMDVKAYLHQYADSLIQKIKEGSDFHRMDEILVEIKGQLTAIIDRQISNECLPERVIRSPAVDTEVHKQKEVSKETEQQKEVEQKTEVEYHNLSYAGRRAPVEESSWRKGILFDPSFAIDKSSNVCVPKDLFFNKFINGNIFVSNNFLHTIDSKGSSLFSEGPYQKRVMDILVIEENNDIKLCILSSQDAAFFKKEINRQKRASSSCRKAWLVTPEEKVIQEGSHTWDSFKDSPLHKKAKDLLFQTLFLSGNLYRLNKKENRMKLENWIHEIQENEKKASGNRLDFIYNYFNVFNQNPNTQLTSLQQLKSFLEMTTVRLPLEENKLNNYPEIEALFN